MSIVRCPNLTISTPGLNASDVSNIPGSTVRFTCEPIRKMHGPSSITCSNGGTWTSPPPTCIIGKLGTSLVFACSQEGMQYYGKACISYHIVEREKNTSIGNFRIDEDRYVCYFYESRIYSSFFWIVC